MKELKETLKAKGWKRPMIDLLSNHFGKLIAESNGGALSLEGLIQEGSDLLCQPAMLDFNFENLGMTFLEAYKEAESKMDMWSSEKEVEYWYNKFGITGDALSVFHLIVEFNEHMVLKASVRNPSEPGKGSVNRRDIEDTIDTVMSGFTTNTYTI